jgi:alpha-D-xyloside xylohydrolase
LVVGHLSHLGHAQAPDPTGLDFTASGIANWSNDTGGWQYLPAVHHPATRRCSIPPTPATTSADMTTIPSSTPAGLSTPPFCRSSEPTAAGLTTRSGRTGKQAEPILEQYLKLRYQLMPYIYSLSYRTYQTGAPSMRALFMDFPDDPKLPIWATNTCSGPRSWWLPVTDQGVTSRKVYLPAGADWYNYWTNERFKGGQTITVTPPSTNCRSLSARDRSFLWGRANAASHAEERSRIKSIRRSLSDGGHESLGKARY